ncbi:MAG TPA: serine/threonine-protein kinase [Thermoanaerobaculia bacterium]|nr:serine/threonine-protein kinase [Thermoanaerobaculia bacterium]
MSWSLPGEWSARRSAAPGDPTLTLPGPSGHPRPAPSPALLDGWSRFGELALAGRGGMGRVYRARDRRHRRTVAVKVLVDGRERGDALREARLQARVDHPAVLPVLDHGRVGGFPWFSMPFVAGSTLRAARPAMSLGEALRLVRDLCRAVAAVHRRGIVHCDLNPGNVLVARRGGRLDAWLIDFGIAREAGARRGTPRRFGTPAYMAPEQALAGDAAVDLRTDVYGLGATLYELAARRQPFPAATCEAVLARRLGDEAPPLADPAPDAPAGLDRVVRRCLAREPADRYPSAGALAEALDRLPVC